METEIKKFNFLVCIHPKNGGDDRTATVTVGAKNKEDAEKFLVPYLKKKSAVVDYHFEGEAQK